MRSNVWGRWVVVCFENVLHHAGRATTKALFYLRQGELSTGEGRFFFAKSMVYCLPKCRFSAVEQPLEISLHQLLAGIESDQRSCPTAAEEPSYQLKTLRCSKMNLRVHDVETTIGKRLSIAAESMFLPWLPRKHR